MGEKGRKKSLQNAAIIAMMVKVQYRGVAQLGSALLWGSRGRGFESRRSDCRKTESQVGMHLIPTLFCLLGIFLIYQRF